VLGTGQQAAEIDDTETFAAIVGGPEVTGKADAVGSDGSSVPFPLQPASSRYHFRGEGVFKSLSLTLPLPQLSAKRGEDRSGDPPDFSSRGRTRRLRATKSLVKGRRSLGARMVGPDPRPGRAVEARG